MTEYCEECEAVQERVDGEKSLFLENGLQRLVLLATRNKKTSLHKLQEVCLEWLPELGSNQRPTD